MCEDEELINIALELFLNLTFSPSLPPSLPSFFFSHFLSFNPNISYFITQL